MASTSRMEPHLWCYACSRLYRQRRDAGGQDEAGVNGCARCGGPAAAVEAVVDVVDARVFLDSCHPDASLRRAADLSPPLPAVTVRDAGRDCAVCLEALEPGATALVTPCQHAYHPRCIVPWLEARSTCPLCRTHVGVGDGDGDRDGLVLCRLHGGRLGLGRRVAGRVFGVKVLDADGNPVRPRVPRGFKEMLARTTMSIGALFRRDRVLEHLQR